MTLQQELQDTVIADLGLTNPDPIQLQVGTTPGNMMAIFMPAPINVENSSPEDAESRWAQTKTFKPGRYAGDTAGDGGVNAVTNSGFRVAFI
jgi:hypothetical protein